MTSTDNSACTNDPSFDNIFVEDKSYNGQPLDDVSNGQPLDGVMRSDDVTKKPKLSGKKLVVVVCILMTEMCERLTFYSVVANLVLYGTSVLKYSQTNSADVNNIFSGVVYLMPLLGGFVSDAWAGKFRTILGSGVIYLLGLVLLPASAMDYRDIFGVDDDGSYFDITLETRRALFLASLVFVALGTGGIKANVGPFGAQQLLELGEGAVKSFFNWFYWFINVGALMAYLGVAYIQQNISFAWGFLVPLVSMTIAVLLFVAAHSFYVHIPAGDSVMATSVSVCWQVCTRPTPDRAPGEKRRVFDKARSKYGGSYDDVTVDSVKAVLRILPVFLTIIMYFALYNQMSTTIIFQGERLDVTVGNFKIPASGLNVFNTLVIIILIPIVDRGLYPCMEKLGKPLNHLHRIGIGLVLAALSVVVAGVVEIVRKDVMSKPGGTIVQELGGENFNASTLSVFVQVSEYSLFGASEVFASVCGIEFAYTQAPKSMQGVLTGLFYMTYGVGNFVADGILNAVKAATADSPWISDKVNDSHMEYYFFLLAGLMLIDFIAFLFIARSYRYHHPPPETTTVQADPELQQQDAHVEKGEHSRM